MARFYGEVGYGEPVEDVPGVWVDRMTERPYFGDVVRNLRRLDEGEHLNPTAKLNNSISVVADEYGLSHFHAIKYVKWAGAYWTVSAVEVKGPRLLLSLGEVYNGPKA